MRYRVVAMCSALVVVSAVVAGSMLAHRMDVANPRRFDLGNGSEFEAFAVTTGSRHGVQVGRWAWLDPVRRRWNVARGLLGNPSFWAWNGEVTNGLCLFLRGPEGRWPAWKGPQVLTVLDEHGCRLPHFKGADNDAGQGVGRVYSLGFRVFPRRQPSFDVALAGGVGPTSTPPRRIRVTHPVPWRGEEWPPEAVPAVREAGGVRFFFLGYTEDGPVPRARIRVESMPDGKECGDWELKDLVYTDVTGNRSPNPDLCRRERAWRIEAAFARNTVVVTNRHEAWEYEVAGWPGPGEVRFLEVPQGKVSGGVEACVIGGPGGYRFQQTMKGVWESTYQHSGLDHGTSVHIMRRLGTPFAGVEASVPWLALFGPRSGPDDLVGLAWRPEKGIWRPLLGCVGWLAPEGLHLFQMANAVPGDSGRVRCVVQKLVRVSFTVAPPSLPRDPERPTGTTPASKTEGGPH